MTGTFASIASCWISAKRVIPPAIYTRGPTHRAPPSPIRARRDCAFDARRPRRCAPTVSVRQADASGCCRDRCRRENLLVRYRYESTDPVGSAPPNVRSGESAPDPPARLLLPSTTPKPGDLFGDGRFVSAMTRRASAPPRTRSRAQRRRGPRLWRRANRQRRARLSPRLASIAFTAGRWTGAPVSGCQALGKLAARCRQIPSTASGASAPGRLASAAAPSGRSTRMPRTLSERINGSPSTSVMQRAPRTGTSAWPTSAKRGLDVLNLLLDARDQLRLVSAVDREDLVPR